MASLSNDPRGQEPPRPSPPDRRGAATWTEDRGGHAQGRQAPAPEAELDADGLVERAGGEVDVKVVDDRRVERAPAERDVILEVASVPERQRRRTRGQQV